MFESTRLSDAHTLEGFDCGKESLNTFLVAHTRRADISGVAHVYVWTPLGEHKVSVYFAICPTEAVRNRERRLVTKVSTPAKALGERWRE